MSMGIIETVILAVVQALTEFLPISSSGHLIAAQELSPINGNIGMDVILHFGTLIALTVYFRGTLIRLARQLLARKNPKLFWNMLITTIPAAFFGFIFRDFFESDARSIGVVIFMLVVVGLLMIKADKWLKGDKQIKDMGRKSALGIGFAQALALIPGTSRSGITMLAGKASGMNNQDSAEYAFLVAIPIIFGASLKVLSEEATRDFVGSNMGSVVIGLAVATIVGYLVLGKLIRFVGKYGLEIFGYYRIGLAILLTLVWII